MKLEYTTKDQRMTVTVEGSTQKDLWREISRFQEVFENDAAAKQNGEVVTGNDVRYVVRKGKYTDEKGKEKTAEYFEKRVVSGPMLGYQKSYGILDDGTDGLFPKWNVPDGNIPGFNGWSKYIRPQSTPKQETKEGEPSF